MFKMAAWEKLQFNKMFLGSDCKGTGKWDASEKKFAIVNVEFNTSPIQKERLGI